MVLKFLEYISYIKTKKIGPSSGSLHEKKCILLSVLPNLPKLSFPFLPSTYKNSTSLSRFNLSLTRLERRRKPLRSFSPAGVILLLRLAMPKKIARHYDLNLGSC